MWLSVAISQLAEQELGSTLPSLRSGDRSPKAQRLACQVFYISDGRSRRSSIPSLPPSPVGETPWAGAWSPSTFLLLLQLPWKPPDIPSRVWTAALVTTWAQFNENVHVHLLSWQAASIFS